MLYIVSVASACYVLYWYTIHLFCSCIYILIPVCYSCDVSCLNLLYFCLFVFILPSKTPASHCSRELDVSWGADLGVATGWSSHLVSEWRFSTRVPDWPTSLVKRVNRNIFRLRSTGTGFSYRLMFSPAERVRCIFKLEPPTYVHRKDDEERGSTRRRLNIYIGVKYIYVVTFVLFLFHRE